jgi:hypothetical protein
MKRRIYIVISLLLILFVVSSCNKSKEITKSKPAVKNTFTNPYDSVGQWHNDGVKYILQQMTYIPSGSNNIESYVDGIYGTWSEAVKPIAFGFPAMPNNFDDFTPYSWVDSLSYSKQFKNLVTSTLDLFQSSPGLQVILDSIAVREQRASSLLSGNELNMYYEHLAVAKYAATFWSPVDQGGLNGLQYLNVRQQKSSLNINWWKVFGVDCVGGLIGGAGGYIGASTISVIMQL